MAAATAGTNMVVVAEEERSKPFVRQPLTTN